MLISPRLGRPHTMIAAVYRMINESLLCVHCVFERRTTEKKKPSRVYAQRPRPSQNALPAVNLINLTRKRPRRIDNGHYTHCYTPRGVNSTARSRIDRTRDYYRMEHYSANGNTGIHFRLLTPKRIRGPRVYRTLKGLNARVHATRTVHRHVLLFTFFEFFFFFPFSACLPCRHTLPYTPPTGANERTRARLGLLFPAASTDPQTVIAARATAVHRHRCTNLVQFQPN